MCPYRAPSKIERFHRQACVIPISNATANLAGRYQPLDRFTDRHWFADCCRMQHQLILLISRGSLLILTNRCKSCLLSFTRDQACSTFLPAELCSCWMSSASGSNCFLQGYVLWDTENTGASILQALSPEGNVLVTPIDCLPFIYQRNLLANFCTLMTRPELACNAPRWFTWAAFPGTGTDTDICQPALPHCDSLHHNCIHATSWSTAEWL